MKMKLSREVKIGLFALAMLVSLYLGVNYLKGKEVFSGDRFYYALFDQTSGLQTSAPVLLRGVKVGIKKSVNIPSDSHLVLFANGLMGDKAINLVLGSSGSWFDRGVIIPSEIEGGLFEAASTNIEDLVSEAKVLMNSLAAASTSLNSLLEQNADAIAGIMTNAENVTRQLSDARLDGMISDISTFTAMLRDNSGRFEGIVSNLDEVTGSLAEADLRGTVDQLGASIANLNGALAKLSGGEGTAARLLDDPALYDSLTVATSNLSALLEDLKTNPKRYVHFSLFGKRDKEKKK